MNSAEWQALSALRFNWAPTSDDVWKPSPYHVAALHQDVLNTVMDGFADAEKSEESSPVGLAVLGQRGTGKTHLLGAVREQVQAKDGYFFLISLLEASAFWRSAALSVLDGLTRPRPDGTNQLAKFLWRLTELCGANRYLSRQVAGRTGLTRASLDGFIDGIRKLDRRVGTEAQDTARALALYAAEDTRVQDIGFEFLCSNDEVEQGERANWGLRRGRRSAQEIVRDISRLLALTAPTVIAVDQIDLVIAQAAKSVEGEVRAEWAESLLLEHIAGGLMSLRETTRRTLSVVACLPTAWHRVKTQATDTVQDRFREAVQLRVIGNAELAEELVVRRFTPAFAECRFTAPYPTWPVRREAFAEAVDFTPRELLRSIDAHVRQSLATDDATEMFHLSRATAAPTSPPTQHTFAEKNLDMLNVRFDALCRTAEPRTALDPKTEDAVVPLLLEAGLTAWIGAQGADREAYGVDPQPGGKPTLHARLRRTLDEETEDEAHWAFRAISAPHHISVLNRVRNAITAAGLTEGVTRRRLFLLRNTPWSGGARTKEVLGEFERAGGKRLAIKPEDVQRLMALQAMIKSFGQEALIPWFAARQPASEVEFLHEALGGGPARVRKEQAEEARAQEAPTTSPTQGLKLGRAMDGGQEVSVALEALRKHTAIFAGSGSGKTVLIRRLVEECALRGVSAIVLDPNNDLARLGDRWPVPPPGWDPADTARAEEFHRHTEVVVWTPRRETGRPLSFRPLPDFSSMIDEPDAFNAGIDASVASLAPRAKVDGTAGKALLGQAVLRETLRSFARTGQSDLRGFIGMLGALPEGVSQIDDAEKIGLQMAQLLTAATVNDPLFGGSGSPADPAVLLKPSEGKRARISVISFVGLSDEGQRQSFVNQLQLALFAWIKRNPASGPLGGLFVMDEAQTLAPSGPMTACTHSTLALASQARKYGLGLIFATQAPKGLHNQIPGNAATQLFGLLNAPAQIAAAQEMARAKGSTVSDIARLRTGQFYAAVEGAEFLKIQAPWCLSYHPNSPLTEEEVLDRARGRERVE